MVRIPGQGCLVEGNNLPLLAHAAIRLIISKGSGTPIEIRISAPY